jgi:predicted AlkP superfamily pyrophosphatase or phosphodiesterase
MPSITSELKEMDFCLPDFKNSNLSLMNEFARNKGRHIKRGKKRVILIVDGLGYDTLEKAAEKDAQISRFIERNTLEKISTVFPSYTPSVIISLNSGFEVVQHGIVGDFFSKEYEKMINPFKLSWMPSTDEVKGSAPRIMPRPAILESISKRGGFVYAMRDNVLDKELRSDFVSKANFIAHTGNEDLFVGIEELLRSGNFEFIYAYTDALDHFSHRYSKGGEETVRLTARLLRDIMGLEDKLKKADVELFVFSDHGQIVMTKDSREKILWNDKFMDFLEMPVFGNTRGFFMKLADGKEKAFEDYFEKKYSKKAALFDTEELIKAGIFGSKKPSEFARYNLADKTGITKGNNSFSFTSYESEKFRSRNPYISENKGTHGGMSREEMEIPLLRIG